MKGDYSCKNRAGEYAALYRNLITVNDRIYED
jgi:starch synthase